MSEKLFLYIDILGFSDLVSNTKAMSEIFDRVDALNVHTDRDFGVIVFSDTILVYAEGLWLENKASAVMWLVEFAQDLFYRFIGIDRHFRAYVTIGEFTHNRKSHIDAYYGAALVECYRKEKEIKAMGVFIANALVPFSNIFHTSRYDDDCHFVHIMQHLDRISWPSASTNSYPIPNDELRFTGSDYLVAYDLTYLKLLQHHMDDSTLGEEVRRKYLNTWKLIAMRHKALLGVLFESGFDPNAVTKHDWAEPMRRVGTSRGFYG
jgi:hypothetical protein